LNAQELLKMLERHYIPENVQPAWIFIPEIQAPDSNRRADLICQGLAGATGLKLVGHELKVSRADLIHELDDLSKPDSWLKYCQQWWLVVSDPAFIDGLDIPERWGIMAPPSGRRTRSMTVLRDAPQVKVHDQGPAFRTIAAKIFWQARSGKQQHEWTQRENQSLRQQLADAKAMPQSTRALTEAQTWGLELSRLLTGQQHSYYNKPSIDAQEAADLLLDVGQLKERIWDLRQKLNMVVKSGERQQQYLSEYLKTATEALKVKEGTS
jgi:hypothetical protein